LPAAQGWALAVSEAAISGQAHQVWPAWLAATLDGWRKL